MISTIVQYSTLDFRFLETNLNQLSKFSDEIIIVMCDRFFNGEEENQELVKKSIDIINKYDNCQAFTFEWQGNNPNPAHYHNISRALGTEISKGDWLFFIDGDEIVDDGFGNWFNNNAVNGNNIFWFTCYWYFREPTFQSKSYESCGLLIKKDQCNWKINVREERQQFQHFPNFINGDRHHLLLNEKPLLHHYSWVRSKDDMIKKVKNWGHKNDTNWVKLVEEEFSRPFNGTDFIHGYEYNIVENKFNL